MDKMILILLLISAFANGQVEVSLKKHIQTADSLIISVNYHNKSSEKIVLDGFTNISYEDYLPTLPQKNTNSYSDIQRLKKGNTHHIIKLVMPETKKKLRYQKLYNGEVLDVFMELSDIEVSTHTSTPQPSIEGASDSIIFSDFFLDKSLFNLLWANNAWSGKEFFDNEEVFDSNYHYLILLEPYSSKEVRIDLSFLLKRKATYILQICGTAFNKKRFDSKTIIHKKFGYKPYNKTLKSNAITIVSD